MLKTIFFAGGCFWGTAHLFSLVTGVNSSVAGYANSIVPNPSYEMVCTGKTHAAETVKVEYDDSIIDLSDLIELYFESIDPTVLNRQGNDIGTQYRTGIFYIDPADAPIIKSMWSDLQAKYDEPIVVEVAALTNFYPAEEYHQDYLYKNPNGYCHVNPALFKVAKNLKGKRN